MARLLLCTLCALFLIGFLAQEATAQFYYGWPAYYGYYYPSYYWYGKREAGFGGAAQAQQQVQQQPATGFGGQ